MKLESLNTRNWNRELVFIILIGSWFNISAFIIPERFEEVEQQILFNIERSKDPDEIIYITNLDENGYLNQEFPVKALWLRKSENNMIEPLTRIQKRFAYGIKELDSGLAQSKEWHFQLAAYKNRTFILKRNPDNQYNVFTLSGNSEIAVKRIFIKFDGGSFLSPTISYVELNGVDILSGKEITETINSGK